MPQKIKYPIINGCKECGDCGEFKPIIEYNKARNHLTSRCKSCIKIYHKNYRDKSENKEKSKLYHQEYMKNDDKRRAKNEYNKKYRKQDYVKIKRNSKRRQWTLKQKLKALEYLGGGCKVCGYNKCTAALDFHHIDPSTKEGIKDYLTFENNKEELDKCIILCCRCHREIHAGIIKI